MVIRLPPNSFSISVNETLVPLTSVENGGTWNVGNPPVTLPVIANGIWSFDCWIIKAVNVPKITTIAFRDKARYLFTLFHF